MDSAKDVKLELKQEQPPVSVKIKMESPESTQGIVADPAAMDQPIPEGNVKAEYTTSAFSPPGISAPTSDLKGTPQQMKRKAPMSNERDLNARDYWRRQYKQQENGGLDEETMNGLTYWLAKRQRGANNLTEMEVKNSVLTREDNKSSPIAARAKLGDVAMPTAISGAVTKKEKQLRLLAYDIDQNDPQARLDHDLIHEATYSFGHGKCKPMEGKWTLAGFNTPLYHHQLIGVRWMLGREFSPEEPKGGILADEMGLGKTVQLLACMSQNMPDRRDKNGPRQTLIIAPDSLQSQWEQEIEDHWGSKIGVHVYKASKKTKLKELRRYQIIITNYAQIQDQLPNKDTVREIEKLRISQDPSWREMLRKNKACQLYKIDWYRVVLDEGQAINNRNSNTSLACRFVTSKYRWVLTGTPMTNNTNEFFPYLDFLGTKFNEFQAFREAMGNMDDEEQLANLRNAYRGLSLRRMVGDTFMGKPILQIPKTHPTQVLKVNLSPLEKGRYAPVLKKFVDLIKRNEEAKEASEKAASPQGIHLKLFSYLRFFISHPALVEPNYHEDYSVETEGARLPEAESVTMQYFCRFCRNVLVDARIPECGHALCKNCLNKTNKCPSCQEPFDRVKPGGGECFNHQPRAGDDDDDDGEDEPSSRRRQGPQPRAPGEDELGKEPRLMREKSPERSGGRKGGQKKKCPAKKGKAKGKKGGGRRKVKLMTTRDTHVNIGRFLDICDSEPWAPIPHSAKTKATMELIKQWQAEAPNDKIIIFVQWIPMLNILGRMVFQTGLRFIYLWGQMDMTEKNRSIRAFKRDPEIKIMLISVHCGAYGLNLTAANRAIVFDHWWHKCLENQAFGRIHRIGQDKEVYTAKLVVNGSIDERIMEIQDKKEELIARATSGGKQKSKVTMKELSELVGKGTSANDSHGDEMSESDNNAVNGEDGSGLEWSDNTENSDESYYSTDDDEKDGDYNPDE